MAPATLHVDGRARDGLPADVRSLATGSDRTLARRRACGRNLFVSIYGEDAVEATDRRVTGHRGLLAWQQAFELAASCHELADALPWRTQRALADQIRRAAVSVAANIAEGCGRRSSGDFLRMLRIAHGSLAELETHLLLVKRRAYATGSEVEPRLAQVTKVGQLLGGLVRALERRTRKAKPASGA